MHISDFFRGLCTRYHVALRWAVCLLQYIHHNPGQAADKARVSVATPLAWHKFQNSQNAQKCLSGALRKCPPLHGSRSSREIKTQNASCQMGGREVTG